MQRKLVLIVLFGTAAFLRLWNLGYSDYQGDEIKALYSPKEISSVKFFLEQRKGPMQFLVTAGLKTLTSDYRNRLLVRLPFALAGFGSVILFYLVVRNLFTDYKIDNQQSLVNVIVGKRIALYASVFFTTNGFLIAFSRIVQYQSLVVFFGLLAVYLMQRYTQAIQIRQREKINTSSALVYLVLGFISWAVSVLSHYDGVFFAPPIFTVLYIYWSKLDRSNLEANFNLLSAKKTFLRHFYISSTVFFILCGVFYIPFVLNLAKSTTDYWAGRISGETSGKISSSRYLFSVYQPIYALHIYSVLAVIGFIAFGILIYRVILGKVAVRLSLRIFKSQIVKLPPSPHSLPVLLGTVIWFLLPFLALEAIISIPGTHIYTYLIPLFIVMGFVLHYLYLLIVIIFAKIPTTLKLFREPVIMISRVSMLLGVCIVFIFLTLQSYYVFVDHQYEYPWENKKFLIWTLPKPVTTYHLSLFGFPYFRHWEEIGDYLRDDRRSSFYATNERTTIPDYYIALQKDSKNMGYYIYIYHPQKLIDGLDNKRVIRFSRENSPDRVFANNGKIVSEVYLLPANSPSISEDEFEKYGIVPEVEKI